MSQIIQTGFILIAAVILVATADSQEDQQQGGHVYFVPGDGEQPISSVLPPGAAENIAQFLATRTRQRRDVSNQDQFLAVAESAPVSQEAPNEGSIATVSSAREEDSKSTEHHRPRIVVIPLVQLIPSMVPQQMSPMPYAAGAAAAFSQPRIIHLNPYSDNNVNDNSNSIN